jgi:hypothetical protein
MKDGTEKTRQLLSLSLDVRNTSKLVASLTQLRCLAGLPCVERIGLAVALGLQEGLDERLESHGPMAVTVLVLEDFLLALQVLLSCCGDWQHADVDNESVGVGLGRGVVVRGARIPKDEITRGSVNLDPLVASVGQPLETSLLEQVHLVGPSEVAVLVSEDIVVLLADLVATLEDQKATVLGAVGQEVDEALDTAQTATLRVLILVRPCSVGGQILTVGKRDVDSIERTDEIGILVKVGKDIDDGGLGADIPCERFVGGAVCLDKTLLVNDGQAFFADGRRIIALVAESETLEPILDVVGVLEGLFLLENSLDYTVSVAGKVLDRKISTENGRRSTRLRTYRRASHRS